jgi:hypothetical protein
MSVTRVDQLSDAIRSRIRERNDGCWIWTGATNNGYGRVYTPTGLIYAHRLVYETLVAPIPDHLQLDHLCRVKRCVNPIHLEVVTSRENQARGIKGKLTTHCPSGHAYDEANTLHRANGHRRCRTCHAERERTRRLERTAA